MIYSGQYHSSAAATAALAKLKHPFPAAKVIAVRPVGRSSKVLTTTSYGTATRSPASSPHRRDRVRRQGRQQDSKEINELRASSEGLPDAVSVRDRAASQATPTAAQDADAAPATDPELLAQRDRLVERFAIMQSELGGLFYEMAIRDHVRMEVLIPKAAELQRVDAELGQLERLIETGSSSVGGHCPACGAVYARGAAFCAQCAHPLTAP